MDEEAVEVVAVEVASGLDGNILHHCPPFPQPPHGNWITVESRQGAAPFQH